MYDYSLHAGLVNVLSEGQHARVILPVTSGAILAT